MPWPLTAFADEIAPDLATQLRVIKTHRVTGLDLRTSLGKDVLNLNNAELDAVREAVAAAGLTIGSILTPINAVALSGDAEEEEAKRLARAIHAAHHLGVRRIRVFTPESHDEEAVMDWMRAQHEMAQAADVLLLVENDAKGWGGHPPNAKLLFRELAGPHLMAAFDFASATIRGVPVEGWFPWIVPYLDTLRVRDAKNGEIVPAGQGEGGLLVTLQALWRDHWSGPLALAPPRDEAANGERTFTEAANALDSLLADLQE